MRSALLVLLVAAGGGDVAHADDFGKGASVIFARGSSLYRVDPNGRGEAEVATFTTKGPVRALRTDAGGHVLLADIGGTWGVLPLDGSTKTLTSLPCGPGPAVLSEDGAVVACRNDKPAGGPTQVITLATFRTTAVDVPVAGARALDAKRIVFADKGGVWIAPIADPKQKKQLAPDTPKHDFLPNGDGSRAVGVYASDAFSDNRHKTVIDQLMQLALDGIGARRRALKNARPLDWSHDGVYVVVQDAANACVLHSHGGEYKCWSGFTAQSTSPDARWTLLLGNRDGSKAAAPKQPAKKPPVEDTDDAEPPPPEVAVALPTGPQSLYRAQLEGLYTVKPVLIVKALDGAAVWVPGP